MASIDRYRTRVALALCAAAMLYFLWFFGDGAFQPSVDAAWLVASLAWVAAFWRADVPSAQPVGHPLWLYALYTGILSLFANDWRWVMAGDSHAYVIMGLEVAEHGLNKSLLSTRGPDQYGYLQMVLDSILMVIVSPTAFWSRMGRIISSAIAMAAVFTVGARLVTRPFGLLVALCSATCSVWIVYSYGHLPFMNGIASGYALIAVGLWVRRDPHSRRAWLVFGALSGFMLFLTPNGWFMAPFVWTWLGTLTLLKRWPPSNLVIALMAAMIVGSPMVLQWGNGDAQLFNLLENPNFTVAKVSRLLVQAAQYPLASAYHDSGAFGPQLPWGFRWLFVAGVLVTPFFGKRFPGARFMFLLLAWNILLLAFTQGPYGNVSVKRALILIPLATFFVFLPFWRYLRSIPVVLAIAAVWAGFGVHDLVYEMMPGRTGFNIIDGALEAQQRFGPRVCLYLPNDSRARNFEPGGPLDRVFGFSSVLHVVDDPSDPSCEEVLCYCVQEACPRFDPGALGYTPLEMFNSVELACARRNRFARTGAEGGDGQGPSAYTGVP